MANFNKAVTDNKEEIIKELPKETKKTIKKIEDTGSHYVSGTDYISTGIISLDAMMGGGYAMGRIVEMAGWNNVGKTTLALKGAVQAQKLGFKVLFIDAEKAMDKERLVALGLDLGMTELVQDDIIETGFAKIKDFIEKEKKPVLVIFDSVGESQARIDTQGDVGESRMMARAKVFSTVLNQIKGIIHSSNSVLVLINQYYNTTALYGDAKTTKGGQMIPYVCSQRLELVGENTKSKQVKVAGEEELAGQNIVIRFVKTKVLNPVHMSEIQLSIRYTDGKILEFMGYLKMIKARDLVKLEDNTYYYLGEVIGSLQKLKNYVVKNKEEIDRDLSNRFLDKTYERDVFKKFLESQPF